MVSQEVFIDTLLTCFGLVDAHLVSTPLVPSTHLSTTNSPTTGKLKQPYHELVGALQWLALSMQPDIAFAAAPLTHFSHSPGQAHWDAAKCILCYIKGMKQWRLVLGGEVPEVFGYTDANWGDDQDDHHSIGAYVFKLGNGAISWKSKKQSCAMLSLTEAEYMALCQAAKEAIWLTNFLAGLGVSIMNSMLINIDNQGGITLARNPVFHNCLKHINMQYHYTCELVQCNCIHLIFLPTKDMVTDVLTKSLPCVQHLTLVWSIGLF